ncbi:hypothetical protein HAHE_07160 [Haloferula helveola]|uniref:Uncharacterized protein n=1 Tax=Haloferula helveola TaxID=490095 RepID=A0ABN6H4I1_9BACT|nr:hypothetical protein HAHE_07160 [Haloferula helveola]
MFTVTVTAPSLLATSIEPGLTVIEATSGGVESWAWTQEIPAAAKSAAAQGRRNMTVEGIGIGEERPDGSVRIDPVH